MTNVPTRRHFLSTLGASAASFALAPASGLWALPAMAPTPEPFTFLFLTDTHTEPELDATHGTDMAFRKARTIPADFAIQGGDHVFDALGVSQSRATELFNLYGKTEQDLGLKVYHTIGNHDCFGVYPSSGTGPADPLYGKKMYRDRFGPTWYSFDHKGHHFIVLDSILITPDRKYRAGIEDDQLRWLTADLASQPAGKPIVVVSHIPIYSTANTLPLALLGGHSTDYEHGEQIRGLLAGHNVLGVLQGHVHVNDLIELAGIKYQTCGAICGNWWHGTRLGTPEGFTVVSLANGKMTTRYETYGFHSIAPENT